MQQLVLIAHNLRSTHNVGSLLRTAEGLGVHKVYLTGYTPYPQTTSDTRLPHIAAKLTRQIHKTALDAEVQQPWEHYDAIDEVLYSLEQAGYTIAAVEQAENAVALPMFEAPAKLALIVGREVEGLETTVLNRCTTILEIPMFGQKESFNVVQAAAMALYHCKFYSSLCYNKINQQK